MPGTQDVAQEARWIWLCLMVLSLQSGATANQLQVIIAGEVKQMISVPLAEEKHRPWLAAFNTHILHYINLDANQVAPSGSSRAPG